MPRTKSISDEEYIEKCRRRLQASKKWRVDKHDKTWKRLIELYGNKHFDPDVAMFNDMVAVNMTFSTVNVIYPSVSVNYPKINVMPCNPDDEDASEIVQEVVNYWWRHYDFHDQFRLAMKDMVVVGHGWIKACYKYEEVEAARDPQEVEQEVMQLLMQKQQAVAQNPDDADLFPEDEEIANSVETTEMKVVEDRPHIERVSPFDIFVDPDASDMSNITWICQRVTMPLKEARNNPAWDKKARGQLEGATIKKADDAENYQARYSAQMDDTELWVTVFEYYDLLDKTWCVFPEKGCGDRMLIEPQPMPYAFGQPYSMLRNYEVPENFYPLGDIECIESMQDELNYARSAMLSENKKHRNKWIGNKDALGPDALAAIKSNNEDEVVLVEMETVDNLSTDVIVPMPNNPIPGDLYQMSQVIVDDINNVSGVSEYARGQLPEGRRTATEASMIQDASNARAADKLATVERFIASVARKTVQLAQQYLSTDAIVRIVGPDAATMWVPYSYEDIQGEFDFEVEAGSTVPQNETFKREQAMEFMTVFGPLAEAGIIDVYELTRHVMREGFNIKNPDKFLVPPPMPMEGGDPNADPNAQQPPTNPAEEAQAAQGGVPQQGLQQPAYGMA